MGSCAAPSAKGDDKFITSDYLQQCRIFFSSDLMFGMGENHGQVIESSWDAAVKSSGADTLPNQESGQKLSSDLSEIEPKFVASGHGFCITIVG